MQHNEDINFDVQHFVDYYVPVPEQEDEYQLEMESLQQYLEGTKK